MRLRGHYLAFATLAIQLILLSVVGRLDVITSRAGRGLRALASSEVAAESCGVPVARYKLAVFALAAAFGGLAGGIYAFFLGYVAPSSFPVLQSVEFVVMAVIGGLGTIWGLIVGATAITVLVQALNTFGTRPGMPPPTRRPRSPTPSTRCCWSWCCCSCREDCFRPGAPCARASHIPRAQDLMRGSWHRQLQFTAAQTVLPS